MWYLYKVLVIEDLRLLDNFFFKLAFPVEILISGNVVLTTPLGDGQPAGFLLLDSRNPFIERCLMNYRSC